MQTALWLGQTSRALQSLARPTAGESLSECSKGRQLNKSLTSPAIFTPVHYCRQCNLDSGFCKYSGQEVRSRIHGIFCSLHLRGRYVSLRHYLQHSNSRAAMLTGVWCLHRNMCLVCVSRCVKFVLCNVCRAFTTAFTQRSPQPASMSGQVHFACVCIGHEVLLQKGNRFLMLHCFPRPQKSSCLSFPAIFFVAHSRRLYAVFAFCASAWLYLALASSIGVAVPSALITGPLALGLACELSLD